MKKNILLSGLVALLAIFSGCEMNEEPKSEASVDMVPDEYHLRGFCLHDAS